MTYDELNSALPPDVLTGDQIDDVMEIFGENAIEVVDAFQKSPLSGQNNRITSYNVCYTKLLRRRE